MADNAVHAVPTLSTIAETVIINNHYICVQCTELKKKKLMETVEELKSTRLIIELLKQELSAKLTSTKNDVVNNNNNNNNYYYYYYKY
jgi:hypothetical protein